MEDYQKQIVINLLAYVAQRDILPKSLYESAGISELELNNPETRLKTDQVAAVWANAISLSNDLLFGLHFGESLQLAALGIVGDIVKSSRNVGDALSASNLLVPTITDTFKLSVTHQPDTFTVNFLPQLDNWESEAIVVQILYLLMAFLIHEMDGFLLRKIRPVAVRFKGDTAHKSEFTRVLRCKPDFHSNDYAIIFSREYWNEPIITANYELQKILKKEFTYFNKSSDENQLLSFRIHQFLSNNSYLGIVSLAAIASNFNLSKRTIQRRLNEEKTSYQEIADEVRRDLAVKYIKSKKANVKAICYQLGYNELSAFNKAFKRWTGITPGAFKIRLDKHESI